MSKRLLADKAYPRLAEESENVLLKEKEVEFDLVLSTNPRSLAITYC